MVKAKAAATCVLFFLGSIITVACKCDDDGHKQHDAQQSLAGSGGHENDGHDDGKGERCDNEGQSEGESSPYVVGDWKFSEEQCDSGTQITADTEFRFINPTDRTFNIEYAFFELDGTFCGCDRDTIDPNATVLYTIAQEVDEGFFTCQGRSGALKSIFFDIKKGKLDLDGAEQVGFQTHVFALGDQPIHEPDPNDETDFITGPVMTEAQLAGVRITDTTFGDIQLIHANCVNFLGPI